MTATIMCSNFGGFRCSQVVFVVLEVDSWSLVGYRRWSGARGSFLWSLVHMMVTHVYLLIIRRHNHNYFI